MLLTAMLTAVALMVPFTGTALAAPPQGAWMNPDGDGPGNIVSDKDDGTDGLYHFVVRVADPDGGSITSVQIQIEDGDADANFETIGNATQVGTSDTWELYWDVSAHTPATDVDNDAGTVRAFVTDSANETNNIDQAVTFEDATAETVEITDPANGDAVGFFNDDATIQGTASAGTDKVALFYTKSNSTTNQAWVSCGTTSTFTTLDDKTGTKSWTAACTLAGGDAANQVTGVAARAQDAVPPANLTFTDESGDAHRVSGYNQVTSRLEITPESDSQTTGFCNTYTARLIDTLGNNIAGANIDVHATGPDDGLQFAENDPVEGDGSDPFTAPNAGGHTAEPAARCDDVGEPDDRADDDDAEAAAGTQGEHDNAGGADTKHIEGTSDPDGFQFSITSNTTGTTSILAWYDSTENDAHDAGSEQSDTATKTWQAAVATTVDAEPEADQNPTGNEHQIDARVTDQNGNPVQGQTVHFRVTSGPHADNDLDNNVGTPPGYIGSCNTGTDGRCEQRYLGTEVGTDTIDVFIDQDGDLTPDANEQKDPGGVQKTWFRGEVSGQVCIDLDPNGDLNPADGTHTLTAFVTDGTFNQAGDNADQPGQVDNDCSGIALSDVGVEFEITDDNPDASLSPDTDGNENRETVITNGAGQATATLDNDNNTGGQNAVRARVRGTETYIMTNTAYNFEDISTTGTPAATVSNCDDCHESAPIGFTFNYYGQAETTTEISSNGYLCMTTEGACSDFTPDPIPSTTDPDGIIAAYYEDLDTAPTGDIYYETLGTGPNRRFIVQWESVQHFPSVDPQVTFQIKLFESSGRIEFHYETVEDDNDSAPAVSGVENYDGTDGTEHFFSTETSLTTEAVAFTPRTTSVTGRFQETATKDWAVAGQAANLDCEPEEDLNATGTSHTVTATVTDAFDTPVAGQPVDFEVFAGPHADNDLDSNPATPTGHFGDQVTTNASGQASASYTGIEVGRDDIRCFTDSNDNDNDDGAGEPSDEVSKNWQTAATIAAGNVEIDMDDCDGPFGTGYGGADWESTATNPLNEVHLVCVSVADANGQPIRGATVTLNSSGVGVITDSDGPPPADQSDTNTIDAGGYAEFWIHSTQVGTQNLTASASGVTDTDSATKTWQNPPVDEARDINCEPETATNETGTQHEITCTVTDGFNNPVQGATVTYSKSDSGGATSTFVSQENTSDANGQAQAVITSTTAGTTSVTGELNPTQSECEEAADTGQGGNDQGKPAGVCTDTVTKTWVEPPPEPQCNDGADNDGDGFTDHPADRGCDSPQDDSESPDPPDPTQCDDGVDNDGDGKTDFPGDPGCSSASDTTETRTIRRASTVSIRHKLRPHVFKGRVSSGPRKCEVRRRVVVKKAKPGGDRVVAQDRTDRRGRYRKAHIRGGRGRYYAVAVRKVFTKRFGDRVTCTKARSRTIQAGR